MVDKRSTKELKMVECCCFYSILRVSRTASLGEIKQAYHREARLHHPDRKSHFSNDAMFLRIQEAWECLGDLEKRSAYDQSLCQQTDAEERRIRNAIVLNVCDCRLEGTEAFFRCQCGFDMAVTSLPSLQDDIVACPGCSLVYDTSPLFEDNP